ncbi:hypothetical protein SeLEV6574_g01967 [Synchytrium endobioticum]|uniref:Uncharacterized protein n=1 Tax=Synchytrium endobioticum TaxID=286115 RepID=A0A507DCJ1_9FUNG|nr:hypothetical protein SeLEV6574_g01967 [Synchytrium endobioticum]
MNKPLFPMSAARISPLLYDRPSESVSPKPYRLFSDLISLITDSAKTTTHQKGHQARLPNTITVLGQENNSFVYKIPIGKKSKKTVKQRKNQKYIRPRRSIGLDIKARIPPSTSMGIKYFWKYLTSLNVVKEKLGTPSCYLDIVVSGDSDVFCYRNVKTMVRPTRHRGQYVFDVLDKSLALRKMKLSADDLVVLAVVSGNDYESNIPGAFFNFDEGQAPDSLDLSKGLEKRDKSETLISEARAALVAYRGSKGNKYLLKAHWTPNPFRPLQSVDEAGRYTYSTINRTTPMKCPVPPILKISPKVVECDEDKYQEPKKAPKV